jgi:hypothetical protein
MVTDRNQTVHTYKEEIAAEIAALIGREADKADPLAAVCGRTPQIISYSPRAGSPDVGRLTLTLQSSSRRSASAQCALAPSPCRLKFQRNPKGRPGGQQQTRASAPQKSTLAVQTLEAEDEFERDRR